MFGEAGSLFTYDYAVYFTSSRATNERSSELASTELLSEKQLFLQSFCEMVEHRFLIGLLREQAPARSLEAGPKVLVTLFFTVKAPSGEGNAYAKNSLVQRLSCHPRTKSIMMRWQQLPFSHCKVRLSSELPQLKRETSAEGTIIH